MITLFEDFTAQSITFCFTDLYDALVSKQYPELLSKVGWLDMENFKEILSRLLSGNNVSFTCSAKSSFSDSHWDQHWVDCDNIHTGRVYSIKWGNSQLGNITIAVTLDTDPPTKEMMDYYHLINQDLPITISGHISDVMAKIIKDINLKKHTGRFDL